MTEIKSKTRNYPDVRFAVAPMIDWSDRHCRYFHRLFSKQALLYTEMVVADAIIHGPRDRLLGFDTAEHPVALQLGGSDPVKLKEAAKIGADYGYDEINLNVGCPSDRVQSGTFGACLMQTPDVVARCVSAMKEAVSVPVTVKCRIGVDDQDVEVALDTLADLTLDAGADALWVHARKAWLKGLSPKENREIPPLDYDRVYRLKARLGDVFVGINGGINTLDEAEQHLQTVDAVMLGRAAYHNPEILAEVDARLYGGDQADTSIADIIDDMCAYTDRHIATGGRLSHVSRHMVGLFTGQPGARRWRQILSTDATKPGANSDVLRQAYAVVTEAAAEAA
ncbi:MULTISPECIES: tRNA dihydrouridine(20/20a) synthase DusA [Brucella/Ochrobactrum group]|uniref:tRNA-dihydrouridine(20/20a) synthase n=1 Tax=Brucella anthropi (strain ATCC 49188 / DSM 6882 / CCUG 24695 / JCM 21032 / LMG 3331 / NBRC 15819 / NCTC 12168 / Alc 37) TaxID=439375 RepID=A6X1H4_BRUA4|nr:MULTISPECIES: tRNA dihydrouridine(20/20a) synthase DusA [Brucella/Ochrobactrum group]ABS15078.1 TIM-barrel protein, yjbN family [Brucella anthropi ATCC 49188]KAB2738610.1 tRNA dihydrouridine(20/20a) synthase DusA [Brucella anthropi]KAB2749839.1 tRNA dihydrouridine(20/20a) synthase DusA [Brucella anthropi]KAB2783070.1 tRNA dihydrouridine(20/20a) synthase DusA [Brucella anthropi]MCQ9146284.1 tRNA dihydrouridine(20/20a) synthase DusA [Ochrobactrum sp. BTU2]